MGIITKLFGTRSERELKKLMPVIDRIESLSEEYAALSDEELNQLEQLLGKVHSKSGV